MYSVIILINKERCFMFKMKKLASIAAAAAMTATAMTGLVSTASADGYVDQTFVPENGINREEGGNGPYPTGRVNDIKLPEEDITFSDKTSDKMKKVFGDGTNIDKNYISKKIDYIGQTSGIPTLTANLTAGTYSLYYLAGNDNTNSHAIENINFYNESGEESNVKCEAAGLSELAKYNGSNLYVHRFLFTLNESFNGTIKFISTSSWLPDLYAVNITNDPDKVISFGSSDVNDEVGIVALTLGDDSLIAGTGSIKNDNGIRSEGLATVNGKAQLRYPAINMQNKKITKIAVKAGIASDVSVDLDVNVGGTTIASKKAVTGNG